MTAFLIARRRPASVAALLVASCMLLGSCKSVTDSLLDTEDPDLIVQGLNTVEGALSLRNGALDRFRSATGGAESTWLFGGLLADEWSTSSTFVQNDETDQRSIQLNNGSITGFLRNLARARTASNQALTALKQYAPTQTAAIGEMYFTRGFAEMQLASDFCNGIPLTDGTAIPIAYGTPQTVAQVFTVALASLDSSIAANVGTDATSVSIRNAARIARARVLLGLNRVADAGAGVTGIPTTPD